MLFIDIDHFKHFDDDYGHDGGDMALRAVAQALKDSAKRPLDFVCRWGGEEFVIILPHTTEDAASKMAEGILQTIRQIQLTNGHGHCMRQVTVSIGVACTVVALQRQGEHLILNADQAMQAAKQAGRDRVVIAPPPKQH